MASIFLMSCSTSRQREPGEKRFAMLSRELVKAALDSPPSSVL